MNEPSMYNESAADQNTRGLPAIYSNFLHSEAECSHSTSNCAHECIQTAELLLTLKYAAVAHCRMCSLKGDGIRASASVPRAVYWRSLPCAVAEAPARLWLPNRHETQVLLELNCLLHLVTPRFELGNLVLGELPSLRL